LPTLKAALLNKKGIFDTDTCYSMLGKYVDKICRLLFQRRSEKAESLTTTTYNTTDSTQAKTDSQNQESTNSSQFKYLKMESKMHDPHKVKMKGRSYDMAIQVQENAKMSEYMIKMKNSLRSVFVCSILSDKE